MVVTNEHAGDNKLTDNAGVPGDAPFTLRSTPPRGIPGQA
jgi:hypothetical protein